MNTASILPLELRNVFYSVGDNPLIRDVSVTLDSESRTIILGPNGAGKSLLLRLCHGLIKPTNGSIIWQGAPDENTSHFQAMVFQRPVMLRRSVAANIAYVLSLYKIPKPQHATLIDEALTLAGLTDLAHRPARVLSAGEQQKLALARAWVTKPQVLFLDEPSANLDPGATHAVEETIEQIHDHGTKIIMTTHDLGQARRLADEVLFFHQGRMIEQTPARTFFGQPRSDLAQAFLRGELLWQVDNDVAS
ncbi:MAG: ATP-binding cassette domain-containing protein [Rhodospirillales bacterium]|jgi:tungstate transport system ATP-binding protein